MGAPQSTRKLSDWIPFALLLLQLLLLFSSSPVDAADLAGDANGLAAFKNAVDLGNNLTWNGTGNVCRWKGVQCSGASPRVTSIRLPGSGLFGAIPSGSLGQLTELRVMSLRSNKLSGSLPADLSNCRFLRSIYLLDNQFSGSLPSDFTSWPNLVHLDFSVNNFSGIIPPSLGNLTQLKALFLENNSLSGQIPALNISTLRNFSVAYNRLSGAIPDTLTHRNFSQADFIGNYLCGFPLSPCPAQGPGPVAAPLAAAFPAKRHHRKLSGGSSIWSDKVFGLTFG